MCGERRNTDLAKCRYVHRHGNQGRRLELWRHLNRCDDDRVGATRTTVSGDDDLRCREEHVEQSGEDGTRALAKKIVRGASVTVTGYAPGHSTLAKRRATTVADYLKTLVKVTVIVKAVSRGSLNAATVITTKQ